MTVTSETKRVQYNGDDSTTQFTVSFFFLDEDHLDVILTDSNGNDTLQTKTTNYTVAGAGDQSGGTVTMVTAPATGEKLTIIRDVPLTQATDYVENDPFPADSHEEALDKLTMITQQLDEVATRALKAPTSTSITDGELTDTEVVADSYLKINSSADGFEAVSIANASTELTLSTALTPTDGNFIVGDGTNWVAESGGTARTSLGVGTGDSPTFTGLTLTGDLTLSTTQSIKDAGGDEYLKFVESTTPVNEITITSADTGSAPSITATGDDTNVGLTIDPKGTGTLTLGSADATVAVASTVTIIDEIQHAGDINNKIGFTTDVQTFTTGGSTRMDITDSGVQFGGSGARITTILDEDNLVSDSATALATQQSIKAYVDSVSTDLVNDTTPQLGGQLDVNGNAIGDGTNELLTFTEDASAVNHVNIENEATGSGPIIRSAGDDANVDLNISAKGTGNISLGNFVFDGDATVGAGQDNFVLTYDDGAGIIGLEASGASAGLVHLGTQTASASATIDFASSIDSTYDEYLIVGTAIVPASDGVHLEVRTSTDGGSTFDSGAGNYSYNGKHSNTTGADPSSTSATEIQIHGTGVSCGTGTGEHTNFRLWLSVPSNTSLYTSMRYDYDVFGDTALAHSGHGSGARMAAEDVDAIRFFFDSGNIASGTFRLYGIVNS